MKYIELTQGYKAAVDNEDYERINVFNWSANVRLGYVRAVRMSKRKSIYMQHEILGIMPWELNGLEIDHIDRNPLNNQKENLRICTHKENGRNTLRHINRVGYCFNKRASLWLVYLDRPDEKRRYLGYRKTKEEAIKLLEACDASYQNRTAP